MKKINPYTELTVKSAGFFKDWWDASVNESKDQWWNPMGPIVRGWDRVGHGSYDATGGVLERDLDQVLDGVQQMGSGTAQAGGSALLSGLPTRGGQAVLRNAVPGATKAIGSGVKNTLEGAVNPMALLNRAPVRNVLSKLPQRTPGRNFVSNWARRADLSPSVTRSLYQGVRHPVQTAKSLFNPSSYKPLSRGSTYSNFFKDRAAVAGSSLLGPSNAAQLFGGANAIKDYESTVFPEDNMGTFGSLAASGIDNAGFLLSRGWFPGFAQAFYSGMTNEDPGTIKNPYLTQGHRVVGDSLKAKPIPSLAESPELNRVFNTNPAFTHDAQNRESAREFLNSAQDAFTHTTDSGSRFINPFGNTRPGFNPRAELSRTMDSVRNTKPAYGADLLGYMGRSF